MELIQAGPGDWAAKPLTEFTQPIALWRYASAYVMAHHDGMIEETWSQVIKASQGFDERYFMREYTWAVHVSGYSARVVSAKFNAILQAHGIIDANGSYIPIGHPDAIILSDEQLQARVIPVWKNKAKAKAVQKMRKLILDQGWSQFYLKLKQSYDQPNITFDPGLVRPEALQGLPFIGPVLARHLARNLGNIHVVKPDLHLKRLANQLDIRIKTPDVLCSACADAEEALIQNGTSSLQACHLYAGPRPPLGLVDLILWRAAVDCGTA